jgi:hypothetical protein
MRNKILSTAIATALSMGIHGVVQAQIQTEGTLILTGPSSKAPTFATELFPTGISFPQSSNFKATYRVTGDVSKNFYATFTLTGGTWGETLSSNSLTVSTNTTANTIEPALVDMGEDNDNQATFLIPLDATSASLNNNNYLEFTFQLDDEDGVLSSSNAISLGVDFPYAPDIGKPAQDSPTALTVARAEGGISVSFDLNPPSSQTFIDVAQDDKQFANGIDELTASLGTLTINSAASVKNLDLSNYSFNGNGGSLEISNGIFSASDKSGTNVFLDLNDNGIYDDGTDLPADTVTDTTAIWNFQPEDVYDTTANAYQIVDAGIIVKANGTDKIDEQEDRAQALLVLDFPKGSQPYQSRLEHIKRNGTRCKLYNVPYPGGKDNAFFRFTSKTDGMDGVVKGTLYKEDGTIVASDKGPDGTTFTDVDLFQGEVLAVNETKVISNQGIADLATETWTGRATMVINSNLSNMEVLALLRNQQGIIGPLMNLSTGATGDACD